MYKNIDKNIDLRKKRKKKSPQIGPVLLTSNIISGCCSNSNLTYDDLTYDFFKIIADKREPDFNLIVNILRQHLRN